MKKLGLGKIVFYLIALLGLILFMNSTGGGSLFNNKNVESVNYNQLIDYIENGEIKSIEVDMGRNSTAYVEAELHKTVDGETQTITAYAPIDELNAVILNYLDENPDSFTVDYQILSEDAWSSILMVIMMVAVIAFIVIIVLSQQSGGGGGKVMNFGKSKAKLYTSSDKEVTFKNVAGADEEKEELAEVVDFLRYPDRYMKLGARIPKGVLLVGPPGTGKTLLARATAGEAGVPFFTISGSDFVEMFVGVGASRVRDLFSSAKKNAPCIIFIDEIDAVGRHRGAGLGGGNDEREQTLNQLLVEMDGFSDHQGIIIIAATNRSDILDPALLRPGRFDRRITVGLPDVKGREEILQVHSVNKPLSDNVDLRTIAKMTVGFTGADLENVMNEASLLAARKKLKEISMNELQESITRVIAGPEKKSKIVTDDDKKITAYHEAGHALVMISLPNCDPVHEISIIPRGAAGGYTMHLPDKDDVYMSKNKLTDMITSLLGGRAAEEIELNDICTGAVSDIDRATKIARSMITVFGMSDELGPISFESGNEDVFIGRDFLRSKNYSENIASVIDKETKKIIDTCYEKAKEIIINNKDKMNIIVNELLDRETLSGEEFANLFNTGTIDGITPEMDDIEEMSEDSEV